MSKNKIWFLSLLFSTALFGVIIDFSEEQQKTISVVAICGESKLDIYTPIVPELSRAPLAIQQASPCFDNFVVRTHFADQVQDCVILKKFETIEDVVALLSMVGTYQKIPGSRYRYNMYKLTWYYILQECLPEPTKDLEVIKHCDAPLAFLQELKKSLNKPQQAMPQQEVSTMTQNTTKEEDDDWVLVE